jgi:hypothetical protein
MVGMVKPMPPQAPGTYIWRGAWMPRCPDAVLEGLDWARGSECWTYTIAPYGRVETECEKADVDGDGGVGILDIIMVHEWYGEKCGE